MSALAGSQLLCGELAPIIEPGFFSSVAVHVAVVIGAVAAIVAAAVGIFTVMRSQSFAGEALGDIGTAGGSAAFLGGVSALWGIVAFDIVAAAVMELIGIQRPRGRDLATGIVLGAFLGLAALLLYLNTTFHNTTGAVNTILFGSVFTVARSQIPVIAALSVVALVIVAALYRPLLLSSMSSEIAAARGIPVRLIGAAYLLAMALAVALASMTIGTILSTALLVGPAATALRLTKRPGVAIAVAAMLGVGAMWLGVLLAYDSFYWAPNGKTWPVSFFVVTLIFLAYLISGLPAWLGARSQTARA
ncbi:MAG TPA: metal ABC transporter permease [Solirubrobacteraceae bacterium]|nr:metal ABC transporter permease [Solirubrobacteraceae bacterium]